MARLDLATCEAALPPGAAPEWVHLLPPKGRITARDGRQFVLDDPARLVADFEARAVDLPVDFAHQTELADPKSGGPVPVAGWIKELRHDETGLWGRVEWTARAAAMIAAREYRYLSPAFLHDDAGVITRLKSAGLVHNPALQLTALASQEDAMKPLAAPMDPAKPGPKDAEKPALAARLAQALGLPDDTPEDDALALVGRMVAVLAKMTGKEGEPATALAFETTPDPRRFVPVDAVKAMLSERATTLATVTEERAAAKVADALRRGHISPAMKGWATALCRSDEAAFDAFLASVPPAFAHLTQPSHTRAAPPASVARAVQSEAAAAICAQLGLPAGALDE